MTVSIRKRERCGNGWYRFLGIVNGETSVRGVPIGIRLPAAYVESVSDGEAESEVKDALCSEYERLSRGNGGVYVR